jgi:hypothetical protein
MPYTIAQPQQQPQQQQPAQGMQGMQMAGPPRPAPTLGNPLVRRLGLQDIAKRDAAEPSPIRDITEPAGSALAGHVRMAWGRNKLAKEKIDLHLLQCLRARRGVYSPAQLAVIEQSGGLNVVFADLTETKCRAGSAWIRDIVLPVGERPWGLDPTPLADLPRHLKEGIVTKAVAQAQQVMMEMAQGAGVVMDRSEFRTKVFELGEQLREDSEAAVKKIAKKRATRMERVIADRLAQGGWTEAMDAFVEDFCTYPAAILKGPTHQRVRSLTWDNGWKPKVSNDAAQCYEQVPPFDLYPSPAAKDCQKGDLIERQRFWRNDLHALKGLPGYHDDQIEEALIEYSAGHLEGWLWTEAERQRLEKESLYMWLSPPGVIDAINYWGSVPGWKLITWGVSESIEPDCDYEVNCVIVGRFVIYASLNPDPLGARPYRKACYDEIPGAFWGRSVPDLCATHQKMCNAIACALADNLSIASGPQAWVHMDRLAEGEQSLELFPWKVWQLKSDPSQGVNPGVGFFQPQDNSANLMRTYEQWEMRADDATGIPRYTYGNERIGGAGDTASGLAMLMNSAAKGLRRAIGNIDLNVIAPMIYATFINEMLYNNDQSIKGDCVAVPRGAAAILIKESAQQRRTNFLAMTGNPIDMQIIGLKGRAALLREVAVSMELPVEDIVPSEEELEKQQQEAAQAQQQQMQMQMQAEAAQQQAATEGQMQLEGAKHESKMELQHDKAQSDQASQMASMTADIVKTTLSKPPPGEGPIKPHSGLQVARSALG